MITYLIAPSNTSLEISSWTEISSLSRTKQPSCIELQCLFWQNQAKVGALWECSCLHTESKARRNTWHVQSKRLDWMVGQQSGDLECITCLMFRLQVLHGCLLTVLLFSKQRWAGSAGLTCVEQVLITLGFSHKLTNVGGLRSKYVWAAELILVFLL